PSEVVSTVVNPPPTATSAREEIQAVPTPRVDEPVSNARALLAAGDINGASAALEAARALDPAAPSVVELTRLVNQFKVQAEAAPRAARQARRSSIPAAPAPPQRKAPKPPARVPAARPHPRRSQPSPAAAEAASSPPIIPAPVTAPPPAAAAPETPVVVPPPP